MTEDCIVKSLLNARLKLGGVVKAILQDSHSAEDILQDVSIKALARKEEFKDEDHLIGWARISCQNAAIDLYRQQVNRKNILNEAALQALNLRLSERTDESLDEIIDTLKVCLDLLPPKTRTIMHERYKNEESVEKIAHKLGRNLDAIYQTISRSHRKLRECIKTRLGEKEVKL